MCIPPLFCCFLGEVMHQNGEVMRHAYEWDHDGGLLPAMAGDGRHPALSSHPWEVTFCPLRHAYSAGI